MNLEFSMENTGICKKMWDGANMQIRETVDDKIFILAIDNLLVVAQELVSISVIFISDVS
jgi:hypothetical protein